MKVACIYHSIDLDGWMSAAIVKYWQLTNNRYSFVQECNNKGDCINSTCYKEDILIIDFIDYNYGQPIPDLSKYDKVIMCDVSFPVKIMKDLCDNNSIEFIWIDHHISAINDLDEELKNSLTDTDYPDGIIDSKFCSL